MSSRNIRRLMREREETQKAIAATSTRVEEEEQDGVQEDSPDEVLTKTTGKGAKGGKANAFDMLQQADTEDDDEVNDAEDDDQEEEEQLGETAVAPSQQKSTNSKRKKKRKAKKKSGDEGVAAKGKEREAVADDHNSGDEIDRALQQLEDTKSRAVAYPEDPWENQEHLSWEKGASKLLSIDSQHLNPINEMKRLFGRIALERPSRQNQQPQQGLMVDLETALNGKHSPASRGKELGNLAKRRNILMQGQESWPLAYSGGLGMEAIDKPEDDLGRSLNTSFGKYFDIVHRSIYERTQLQFKQEVELMSPDRLIDLLVHNPYHVVSLLQVSEIARHQGDHAVAGDLLERALYIYGRSVHSTFSVAFREGKARITFDRAENREFYLTIWRYIRNLEMRGTWRTAFEWAKGLLGLNKLSDPYSMTLVLDQYALRARKHQALIDLCSEEAFGTTWSHLPNMQISLAVAYFRAAEPVLARRTLAIAMHRYPYIVSALCSELEIEPLPTSLWGKLPDTEGEKFFTELYVSRAKDIWQTPETTAFLVEVAQTLKNYQKYYQDLPPPPKLQISFEDARHAYLLESPSLIALVPRNYRSFPTSQYDVLPPPPSMNNTTLTARAPPSTAQTAEGGYFGTFLSLVRTMFSSNAPPPPPIPAPTAPAAAQARATLDAVLNNADLDEANRRAIMEALDELSLSDEEEEEEGGGGEEASDMEVDLSGTVPEAETPDAAAAAAVPPTQNPFAATVADAADSDLDSDDEPNPNSGPFIPNRPNIPSPLNPNTPSNTAASQPTSTQAIQRWLLTTGLTTLQSSSPASGPIISDADSPPDAGAIAAYQRELRRLKTQDRRWVLGMVGQRLGARGRGTWEAIVQGL